MGRDIEQLDWMSAATKARAEEKLHAVANKWAIPISGALLHPDCYPRRCVGQCVSCTGFEQKRDIAKIGKPVDRGEWDMSPPTVNADYSPQMNDINFPAGILQPPFFDRSQDDAVNYGSVGSVIGHELTHGFNDEGGSLMARAILKIGGHPRTASNLPSAPIAW